MPRLTPNERSEVIEAIKEMDAMAQRNTWRIKSVGGESTLSARGRHMFPDVFLYGDSARTQVLQGWECKMPDVSITDGAFISDAQRKADTLNVNSCLLWNFAHGVLYVKGEGGWTVNREWAVPRIRTRADVKTCRSEWVQSLNGIFSELNEFFSTGELRPASIGDIVADTVFSELIRRNKSLTAEHLRTSAASDTTISANIAEWWRSVHREYRFDEPDEYAAYAKCLLTDWINKITFAHMIKQYHNPAKGIERVTTGATPSDALKLFAAITEQCDFFNVFRAVGCADVLPPGTWRDLVEFNIFLSDKGFAQISAEAWRNVLENSVNQFKRNVSGQFTTPPILAHILVQAGLRDLTVPAIDPCCGTGTIVREILLAKARALNVAHTYSTSYAADKSPFALQVANLAMTRAEAINLPVLLFAANAFDLRVGMSVEVVNPADGGRFAAKLPRFGSVVSNLPFVSFDQEGREEGANIADLKSAVKREARIELSGRVDLYQALLLRLPALLAEKATLAVITSNSWLGTSAGQGFWQALNYYYEVEAVVASGNGKWFDLADVQATMLFLRNKPKHAAPAANHHVAFGLLQKRLPELSKDDATHVGDLIKLKRNSDPACVSFKEYTSAQIADLLAMNISINALFYDVAWLPHLKDMLLPVASLFEVFRGMKTGLNKFYYPKDPEVVEPEYRGKILKDMRDAEYLTVQPNGVSFVCGKSLEKLRSLGHKKALAWIDRYKGHLNASVYNKETFWNNLADAGFSGSSKVRLVTMMNPYRRVMYGLADTPVQIDQRIIGFRPLTHKVNVPLCHALLNSVVGTFYTEAMGFPKGLGALDNSATKVGQGFMLNPSRLTAAQKKRVMRAFQPVLRRKIKTTVDEYSSPDRLNFERVLAECYGYTQYLERMVSAVLSMQQVRLSVAAEEE